MKYSMNHRFRGKYYRKLREDHVDILYDLYKSYGLKPWRSDSKELDDNRSRKQYFLERMSWTFNFIEMYQASQDEKEEYTPNEKQRRHYRITPKGLKILVQLGYDIDDEHIAYVTREVLRSDI